jgi:hypothetical protein
MIIIERPCTNLKVIAILLIKHNNTPSKVSSDLSLYQINTKQLQKTSVDNNLY